MNLLTRIQAVLFGGFFFLIAAALAFTLLTSEFVEINKAKSAVAVTATVASSKMLTFYSDSGGFEAQHTPTLFGTLVLDYKYKNTHYQSIIDDAFESEAESATRAFMVKYKQGQKLTAFIDPLMPTEAVLAQQPVRLLPFAMLTFVSVFALFGGGIILIGIVPESTLPRPTRELIFDTPVAIWILFNVIQLCIYFTYSASHIPNWAYVWCVACLGSSIWFVHLRQRVRNAVRLPVLAKTPPPPVVLTEQQKLVQKCFFAFMLVLAMGANFSKIGPAISGFAALPSFIDQSYGGNPERATVYSKEKAIADIPEREKSVVGQPGNIWAIKQRGLNYFDAEMYDKAIPDFTRTLKEAKQIDDQSLEMRARCYNLTRQWQKAYDDYALHAKLYHKPWEIYFANRGMGICNYHLQKFDQAEKNFTTALKQQNVAPMDFNDVAELRHDRALCYNHLGKTELASADRKDSQIQLGEKWWLK